MNWGSQKRCFLSSSKNVQGTDKTSNVAGRDWGARESASVTVLELSE